MHVVTTTPDTSEPPVLAQRRIGLTPADVRQAWGLLFGPLYQATECLLTHQDSYAPTQRLRVACGGLQRARDVAGPLSMDGTNLGLAPEAVAAVFALPDLLKDALVEMKRASQTPAMGPVRDGYLDLALKRVWEQIAVMELAR